MDNLEAEYYFMIANSLLYRTIHFNNCPAIVIADGL